MKIVWWKTVLKVTLSYWCSSTGIFRGSFFSQSRPCRLFSRQKLETSICGHLGFGRIRFQSRTQEVKSHFPSLLMSCYLSRFQLSNVGSFLQFHVSWIPARFIPRVAPPPPPQTLAVARFLHVHHLLLGGGVVGVDADGEFSCAFSDWCAEWTAFHIQGMGIGISPHRGNESPGGKAATC